MFDINELELTKLLVYGSTTPGTDPNTHIRPDSASAPTITLSMSDYLATGAGRYARPSKAPLVQAFFADSYSDSPKLGDGNYSAQQVISFLSLIDPNDSLGFSVIQYTTDAGTPDFIERAYVFGSTGFAIKDTLRFLVSNGKYSILDMELTANIDNFDFQSNSIIATTANILLTDAFDPYSLIPENDGNTTGVKILYAGSGRTYSSYSAADYAADTQFVADSYTPALAAAKFAVALAGLETNTGYLGAINNDPLFRYYTDDEKKVIYGSPDDDIITVHLAEETLGVYSGYQLVGGAGNDNIKGGSIDDKLWGGDDSDTIDGGVGDDLIIGGAGDDIVVGGVASEGSDTSLYRGDFADYTIEFLTDEEVKITDKNGSRDGSDTLTAVEFAQFSDRTLSLKPGQDIAFVIDTTGSMGDDVRAVKVAASGIVDAIFNPDRNLLNSRIAVVGFNDPGTSTLLSFTDQANPEDRKTAAITAINSIATGGGGDTPEMTYTGLLLALNGGAGEWREEAVARKIVLFGDATAKDADLAEQVYALANNLNAEVSSFSSEPLTAAVALTEDISLMTFDLLETDPATGTEVVVPVQIFTVVIGSSPGAIAEFQEIADQTDGAAFYAARASQVVVALLEILNLPIYTLRSDVAEVAEGDAGSTSITFTVSRDVADDEAVVVIQQSGTIDTKDVVYLPDTVNFAVGEKQKQFVVEVKGDLEIEDDEVLSMSIRSVSEPANFTSGAASTTILNDDNTAPPIFGGNGNQTLTGSDTANDHILGENGQDVLYGLWGADTLEGGNGDDLLGGGVGLDFLFGDRGDDILIGGLGSDELAGGKGNDIFVLSPGTGMDTILDFDVGNDLLGLDGLNFVDLFLNQIGTDTAIFANGEKLAVLIGVNAMSITEVDVFSMG